MAKAKTPKKRGATKPKKSPARTAPEAERLGEDCLVDRLRKKNALGKTKLLIGYAAQGPGKDEQTMFLTPTMDEGVTFAKDAIVHGVRFVTSSVTDADVGPSMVWIRKDAAVRYFGSRSDSQAFLDGVFSKNAAALTPGSLSSMVAARTVPFERATTATHSVCGW